MADETVTLTIDDVEVEVAKGTMLIEAAKQAGLLVPHYCYHPALPSPAVCRMCMVRIEKAPKLMPACVTAAAEGQVVHFQDAEASKGREAVLEYLLINHPLDCPICDQSGECELQDYTFQEGRKRGRFMPYPKRYNPVEDFGHDIIYVPNRCIYCTRCVRFMEAAAEEPILNIYERGDRAFVGMDQDQRLDHPWSGNVVDLCPVGSLLSKDFLHKARTWELDKSASICTGCSQGCNISIDTRDDVVVRLRPRPNLEVNSHFMCDEGREDYRWMNRGDRVEAPLLGRPGDLRAGNWDDAVGVLAATIRETAGSSVVLFGRRVSCETIGWTMRLFEGRAVTAAYRAPVYGEEAPLTGVPGLARRTERAPNRRGAELLGVRNGWQDSIDAAAIADLVIVVDAELDDDQAAAVAGAATVIHLATVPDPRLATASLVLPLTSMAEETGVYVNRDSRAQRYLPARTPAGMARPGWWIAASAWALLGADRTLPGTAAEAFAALPTFEGLTHRDLGFIGRVAAPVGSGGAQ